MEKKSHHYCYNCHLIIKTGSEKDEHEKLGHDVDQYSQEYYEALEHRHPNYNRLGAAALLVIALFASAPTRAWEYRQNPDRFPSVALNVSNESIDGNRTETDEPTQTLTRTQWGPESHSRQSIGADVRLPINNGVTLSIFGDRIDQERSYERQNGPTLNGQTVFKESANLTGYRYGFSVRVYFNK